MHLISRFTTIRWPRLWQGQFFTRWWQRSRPWHYVLLTLGILVFVLISQVSAAQTVLLQNRDARLSLPIAELQEFARSGKMSTSLSSFLVAAEQDPATLREALNSPVRLGRTALIPREFALIEINQAVGDPLGRENRLDLLRQSLRRASQDDQTLTLLEIVENYPGASVRITLNQVLPIYETLSQLVHRIVPIFDIVENLLPEMVCDPQGNPVFPTAPASSALLNPGSAQQNPERMTGKSPLLTPIRNPVDSAAIASLPTDALPNRTLLIQLGPLQVPITLRELSQFANTGELPGIWKFYLNLAKVNRDDFRSILNRPVKVSTVLLDQVLNNLFGEYLLYQVGQVVHSESRISDIQALRSALVLAAAEDNTITFLEVLQNYPHPRLFLDAGKLLQVGSQIGQWVGESGGEGAIASIEDVLINWQRPIAQKRCLGQPLPAADQPKVTPLQIAPDQRAQYLPPNWQPVPAQKKKVGNINVVWLQGTPYEMGLQHGQLLKQEIATLGEPVLTILDLFGRGLGLSRLAEKRSLPYASEECRGMAEGAKEAGLTYDACMVLAFGDVYQYAFGNALPQELLWEGCSQFVAAGSATVDGELYHGSTVDSSKPMSYLINNPVVFVRQPNQGLPHVFVTYPGVVWPNSGLNVASITLGLDTAITDSDGLSLYGGSNVQLMAEILQGATRFDEATRFLETQPRVRPNIIMGADGKSQQAGVYEFSGTAFNVRRMDESDVIYTTNHFASDQMFDKQIAPNQSSKLRFQRYQQLLAPDGRDSVYGKIDAATMVRILRDRIHPETLQPSPVTVFDDNASPGGNGAQRQAIFKSKSMLFWVAAGPPPVPQNAFQCFSLGQLLGFPNAATCPAPAIP